MIMAACGGEILVLLLLIPAQCFAQEILHAPESTTVFLNKPAVFTCETGGGDTLWLVNGTQLGLLPDIRSDLVLSEEITTPEGSSVQNLTIPARPQYNGTRVQCASVIFRGPVVESDNATLTIQGPPLSAVGDLKVDAKKASSVTISWSAPFSLDVTGVDPDIWYSVLIYNVTDENNPTAIPSANVTNTSYTFTPGSATPCQKFLFSVIPFNGAGQGESSPNVTGYVINSSALITTQMQAISREKTNVTFMARSNPTSEICSSWRVTPDVMDDLVLEKPPSPEGPNVTYQLRADKRYSFLVSLPIITSGETPPRINFTTYDVQSAAADTTKGTNNEIKLNGEFIKDTTALGCFVVLQCEYGNPDVFIALLLPDDSSTYVQSTIHDILSSTYHMFVYDLEEDGLPNSHPAVEQNTTVTVVGNGPIADAESEFINNASLYWNGSAVNVRCEFKEGIEGASCVLVYREYGNKTLVVEEYTQNTVFPVTLTVGGDLEKYTLAIFGKDGSMVDQRPIIAGRVDVTETTTPTITVSASSDGSTSPIAIGVSATVSFIIVTLVILAVVVLILWRKSHKGGYSSSDVVPSYFCSPSPSECSNASVASGSQLISDDGGTKPKKDEHAEGEAKPPFSGKTSYQRQDSGVSVSTPPVMSKQKGMYTDVKPSTSGVQPPIPEDTRVQYQEIDTRTTHKMARSAYADLGPLPTNRPKTPKIETKTQGPYVDVLPIAATPVTGNGNRDKKNADKATPKGPPTVESMMSLLWGVAGRWKEIAEGMEFDEDLIDEIDTNNDMDEGCLRVCVEMWVFKLQPSWEKLSRALRDLGEEELARQAGNKEPQEQWQVPSRQTSDSSSSGIVADASSQSTDFSGEVVLRVRRRRRSS
ncbi:hypothetical protein GBAR_LOCUS23920 [Geodia barretti]|nr:hypothetical protein GBAR_LOCUS23920 [Geodia barretti]